MARASLALFYDKSTFLKFVSVPTTLESRLIYGGKTSQIDFLGVILSGKVTVWMKVVSKFMGTNHRRLMVRKHWH
jgi:hypothetical protein